jgi:hypothetical protein
MPGLAAPTTFSGHIAVPDDAPPRQRELLALREAARRDAEYVWAQRAITAGDVGIDASRSGGSPTGRTPRDGRRPTPRSSVRSTALGDASLTTDAVATELDQQQLMDLVFTVGAYDLLAMAMRSFGVELDDDLVRKS